MQYYIDKTLYSSTLKPRYSEQICQTLFLHYIEKFTISNAICLVNPQNGSWVLLTISWNSLYQGSLYQGLSVRTYYVSTMPCPLRPGIIEIPHSHVLWYACTLSEWYRMSLVSILVEGKVCSEEYYTLLSGSENIIWLHFVSSTLR